MGITPAWRKELEVLTRVSEVVVNENHLTLLSHIEKMSKPINNYNIKSLFPILKQLPKERFETARQETPQLRLPSISSSNNELIIKTKKRIIIRENEAPKKYFISPKVSTKKLGSTHFTKEVTPSTKSSESNYPLNNFGQPLQSVIS